VNGWLALAAFLGFLVGFSLRAIIAYRAYRRGPRGATFAEAVHAALQKQRDELADERLQAGRWRARAEQLEKELLKKLHARR
jgi:hypothetical protein